MSRSKSSTEIDATAERDLSEVAQKRSEAQKQLQARQRPEPELVSPVPPVSIDRPVLRQRWAELAYFHWPYSPDAVQRLLPHGLRVDTFDDRAWVGLIPFEMQRVQIGPTPAVPWLGDFIEINVRTYVIDPLGRRAVWFFSLDVPRSPIVAVARSAFALPYCWSEADHDRKGPDHRYRMKRRWPRGVASADMRFKVGAEIAAPDVTDLDHFLTARWALVTERRGRLLYGQVDHPSWPLHVVEDVRIDQDVIEAAGLPSPAGLPRALYSPGVDVGVARFRRISSEGRND